MKRNIFVGVKRTLIFLAFLATPYATATANLSTITLASGHEVQVEIPETKMVVFKATKYYRPLRGQSRYATGTYEGDVRLNGTGITRSGKTAAVGHVAADLAIYPLGTKLKTPDGEILEVTDSGGAIKGNRIDIFEGVGEDALERALIFGKQEIVAAVLGNG